MAFEVRILPPMREISSEQRRRSLRTENPWWEGGSVRSDYSRLSPRGYFERLTRLVMQRDVRRAVVLMGPRRVGKTVLLHHVIEHLLKEGVYSSHNIAYLSLDQPLYARLSIEELASEIEQAARPEPGDRLLVLDEIQYLPNWEWHLKAFVDTHPGVQCIASGSAAAALRLKSAESGAGRFTDFLLPPLTFHEYLDLRGKGELVTLEPEGGVSAPDIEALNQEFVDYCNFGGYPEAAFSEAVREDPDRYIRADIVDKVLLRDLPSLYGIQDVQELNLLFSTLAYNTANELSLEELSQDSGVSKPTLRRYLEYLEAAFLIKIVHRIDHNAHRFKRATRFKVYLTAPALRCALFGATKPGDDSMGAVAETAVFAQWFHANFDLHYAHWTRGRNHGEVDIVALDKRQQPLWCVEVKWTDRFANRPQELTSLKRFADRHPESQLMVTTRSATKGPISWQGTEDLHFIPTSLYCYVAGRQAVQDPNFVDAVWKVTD